MMLILSTLSLLIHSFCRSLRSTSLLLVCVFTLLVILIVCQELQLVSRFRDFALSLNSDIITGNISPAARDEERELQGRQPD